MRLGVESKGQGEEAGGANIGANFREGGDQNPREYSWFLSLVFDFVFSP